MGNSQVILIPCDTYDEETVYKKIKDGLNELGGITQFVKTNEHILVKPNFLSPAEADAAVTTHPSVLKAVFRILQESECKDVIFGDSPGHGSCRAVAEKLYLNPNEMYGAKLSDMSEEVHVDFPEGMTCNEFYFTKEVTEADAIINVCKMKTHCLERVTGAVKNVYGFVCGHRKAEGHVRFPNASVFARQLVDIHRCTKPRLHIMDGIVAMEGNGPGSGTPTPMNVIMLGTDPVALDAVFCNLIYLNPESVPTNSQGYAMGIGTYKTDEITITIPGEGEVSMEEIVSRFGRENFDVDRTGSDRSILSNFSRIMTTISKRPKINKKLCIKCGICVSHCPVPGKAVQFKNGKDNPPVYDYKKCIRCYCCQEMCPQSAIHNTYILSHF